MEIVFLMFILMLSIFLGFELNAYVLLLYIFYNLIIVFYQEGLMVSFF